MSSTINVVRMYREAIDKADTRVIRDKPVRKLENATKFLPLPIVRQSNGYTCGAAAFLSLVGYYGHNPNEDQVAKALKTTTGGTNPEDFDSACKKFGLTCERIKGLDVDHIHETIDQGFPMVLAIQAWRDTPGSYKGKWEDGHYVVAVGYDDEGIYLMDPSWVLGYSYIFNKDLLDRWHDIGIDRKKTYLNYGIVVHGKDPKFNYDDVYEIH